MSPYRPSRMMVPAEQMPPGLADQMERVDRAIQDGICPNCQTPLWPETYPDLYSLDCDECGFTYTINDFPPHLN